MERRPLEYALYVPVNCAAAALGYLQAIAASLASLSVILYFSTMPQHWEAYLYRDRLDYMLLALILMASIIFCGYLITVAVLLVIGVKKRHSGYVLAYLITGSVKAAALLTAWALSMGYEDDWYITLAVFGALVLYSVWLYMVYCVYCNIKLEKNPNSMIYNSLHNTKNMEAQKIEKPVI